MKPSYEASVHGKALAKGIAQAPSCSSCHNAHNIESTTMTTKIKEGCLRCHKDAAKAHNKWLKNPPVTLPTFAKAHFDVVSCATCHSPGAERRIYLTLHGRKTGKPLAAEEAAKLLGTTPEGLKDGFDSNKDGKIDGRDLWNVTADLFKMGVTPIFMGTMDVGNSVESHMIAPKAETVKDCNKCHLPNAEFFQNVFIAVKKADGKPTLIAAEKDTVKSVFSIVPVSKFYAIGGSSIGLWDILFVVALIGGIAVPIGHMSLRILFSPIRSLRKMGKGGKK
jgi:predicted CXXCH cytochrome family protein